VKYWAPLLSGALFAIGLALAGMTLPRKVIGFLDFAGDWDPSLALVMVGAIPVYAAVYWWSRSRLDGPAAGNVLSLPAPAAIDGRLLLGSTIFGVGWGLAGYCPGPAFVSAAGGIAPAALFSLAMMLGFWATRTIDGRLKRTALGASSLR